MDTRFTPEEEAFKVEVRAFIDEYYTDEIRAGNAEADGPSYQKAATIWQRALGLRGWSAANWPVEFGGTGWTTTQRYLFDNELSAAGAPKPSGMNISMVGPVIYTYGTEAQKQQFLEATRKFDIWWCQGYSEPGAGSDLASLQTHAVRDGDDYIINGTKVWTTYAQFADWMFCLVRTNSEGRKQQGITFLLIDMKTEGIAVNEIKTIDGFHSLNEVVLTDVRVPIANRVGNENEGWTYAKSLLAFERTTLARVSESKKMLAKFKTLAREETSGGVTLIERPAFAQRLARIEIELMSLEYTELRVLATVARGESPGAESSTLKLKGTEVRQRLQSLGMEIAGHYQGVQDRNVSIEGLGHEQAQDISRNYMHGRASSILGGSSEVQHNVIAKTVLGLS